MARMRAEFRIQSFSLKNTSISLFTFPSSLVWIEGVYRSPFLTRPIHEERAIFLGIEALGCLNEQINKNPGTVYWTLVLYRPTVSLEKSVIFIIFQLVSFAKCVPSKVLKRLSSEPIVNKEVSAKQCKMVKTRVP